MARRHSSAKSEAVPPGAMEARETPARPAAEASADAAMDEGPPDPGAGEAGAEPEPEPEPESSEAEPAREPERERDPGVRTLEDVRLGPVVDALCQPVDHVTATRRGRGGRHLMPSRDALIEMLEALRAVLFPGYYSRWDLSDESLHFYVGATVDKVLHVMQEQVKRGLCLSCDQDPAVYHGCDEKALRITRRFLARLPHVRRMLATDVEAAFEGDPATRNYAEIVFSYPGLRALTDYRLAHELHRMGVPLIPRIITEYAHGLTGIDIHPGATIGERFFIDHGTGVVVGETAVIGKHVRIYQGVTLGAKSFPLDDAGRPIKGIPRHPIVEDDVIIYSGATILGRVTIGKGSVIGGNVWLTRSVPEGSAVTQSQARSVQFEAGGGI